MAAELGVLLFWAMKFRKNSRVALRANLDKTAVEQEPRLREQNLAHCPLLQKIRPEPVDRNGAHSSSLVKGPGNSKAGTISSQFHLDSATRLKDLSLRWTPLP